MSEVVETLTMLLDQMTDQHRAHAINPNTFKVYSRHWQAYINQLDEDMVQSFEEVRTATLNKYLRPFIQTPSAYSLARAAIFKLLKQAAEDGACIPRIESFNKAVKPMKAKGRTRLFMTHEQLDTVYDSLKYRRSLAQGVFRDRLIFRIIRETLLRSEEVRNINVADIDVADRLISVRGKGAMIDDSGQKVISREVYCSASLMDNIADYLAQNRYKTKIQAGIPRLGDPSSYAQDAPLFTSVRGIRLSASSVKGMMSDAIKYSLPDSDIKASSGAHAVRRSSATIIYKKTHDIVLVQRMLGHADPKTTMVYIGVGDEDLRNGFDILNGGDQGGQC